MDTTDAVTVDDSQLTTEQFRFSQGFCSRGLSDLMLTKQEADIRSQHFISGYTNHKDANLILHATLRSRLDIGHDQYHPFGEEKSLNLDYEFPWRITLAATSSRGKIFSSERYVTTKEAGQYVAEFLAGANTLCGQSCKLNLLNTLLELPSFQKRGPKFSQKARDGASVSLSAIPSPYSHFLEKAQGPQTQSGSWNLNTSASKDPAEHYGALGPPTAFVAPAMRAGPQTMGFAGFHQSTLHQSLAGTDQPIRPSTILDDPHSFSHGIIQSPPGDTSYGLRSGDLQYQAFLPDYPCQQMYHALGHQPYWDPSFYEPHVPCHGLSQGSIPEANSTPASPDTSSKPAWFSPPVVGHPNRPDTQPHQPPR